MLPFLQPKRIAGALSSAVKVKDADKEDSNSSAAHDLINAIESKDAGAVEDAIKSLITQFSGQE